MRRRTVWRLLHFGHGAVESRATGTSVILGCAILRRPMFRERQKVER
jgi:hypothetical protein